jgi:hypothetical protein
VTYRIYQLLEDQKKTLLDFLMADSPPTASPLPILGDGNNWKRIGPEEPIETTGIYRDVWERKELSADGPDRRSRDAYDKFNYPLMDDWHAARERWLRRNGGGIEWRIQRRETQLRLALCPWLSGSCSISYPPHFHELDARLNPWSSLLGKCTQEI